MDLKNRGRRKFLSGLPLVALTGAPAVLGAAPRAADLKAQLDAIPLFDTHEHILPESERVRTPVDFFTLVSHYTSNDLVSAGLAPAAARGLTDTARPVAERWRVFAPFWERAQNTGYARALRIAVRDVYGAAEVNERACVAISEKMQAANRPGLYRRVLTEMARIETAVLDDYWNAKPVKPEGPWFVIARKFDRFVQATSRKAIEALEALTGRSITTLEGLEEALVANFTEHVRAEISMVAVKSTLAYARPIHYREVSRHDAARSFDEVAKSRALLSVGPPEHPYDRATQPAAAPLQDYMFHRLVQLAREHRLPMQIHTGILSSNAPVITNTDPTRLTNLFLDYPQVKFDLFHAGYPYLGEVSVLAKCFPNVYADLCWVHVISPEVGRRALSEYLETVPASKILAFGGDYRYPELSYAHAVMARDVVSRALAEKIQAGFMTEAQALACGRRILRENGRELFLPAAAG